jgi:hypothetical protein
MRSERMRRTVERGPRAALLPWLLLTVGIGACQPEQETSLDGSLAQERGSGEVPAADTVSQPTPSPPGNVETITRDTILLEGMPEVIDVRRVESPTGFPLPFATTIPGDMEVVFEEDAVRFEAAFGGVRSPQAFLELRVLGEGTDAEAARETATGSEAGLEAVDPPRLDWAMEEYRRRGEELGFVALAEAGGRRYYFNARYPAEFADGMGPRVGMILDRWTWTADGGALVGDEPGA